MWIIGALLNIIGSFLVNFGTNIIKYSHNLNSAPTTESVYSSSSAWKTGVACLALGSSINFASFAFAAQSLLAALSGVQFLSNVLFYRFILKEKLTTRIALATTFLIAGLTCAVSYSNHNDAIYTSTQLIRLYDVKYFTYLGVIGCFSLFSESLYLMYTTRESLGCSLPYSKFIRPLTFSFVSATVGTQSVLQSKCIAEMLKAAIKRKYRGQDIGANSLLEDWFAYTTVTLFVMGSAFWLYRLNKALKLFDGMLIIPLLQAFWTIMAVVQGGLYFKEFENFTLRQYVGFTSGIVLLLCGVCLLAPAPAATIPAAKQASNTRVIMPSYFTPSKIVADPKATNTSTPEVSEISEMEDFECRRDSTDAMQLPLSSSNPAPDSTQRDQRYVNLDSDSVSGNLMFPQSWRASLNDYLTISSSMHLVEDRHPLLSEDAVNGIVDYDNAHGYDDGASLEGGVDVPRWFVESGNVNVDVIVASSDVSANSHTRIHTLVNGDGGRKGVENPDLVKADS